MKKKYYIILSALLLAAIVFFVTKKLGKKNDTEIEFGTAQVTRGDIFNTISATGALEALETVEVGTQVSGVIKKIYVDFNTTVKKGQILARIDETPLLAQLSQSQASVDQAEAEFIYLQANHERNLALYEKQLISQADFDQVVYNYNISKARLANAQAQHKRNEINLNYATITSPIDGVILDRAVDEGQTVAASFNTPTLFTIANDLTQMKVEASIDEADIGQVKTGQRVEFAVDAFPDNTFEGEVTEVRLQPVITNNVVTYTVIINAPNPDYKLMPGMTATTTVFVSELRDQLLVSMTAVGFNPDPKVMQAWFMSRYPGHGKMDLPAGPPMAGSPMPGPGRMGQFPAPPAGMGGFPGRGSFKAGAPTGFRGNDHMRVWVKENDSIYMAPIKVSLNDGINYAVTEGLKEGDEVIIRMGFKVDAGKPSMGQAPQSPFMPQPPRRR